MSWDLIGGDPAPGATWAVSSAASALRTVANLTESIATTMNRDRGSIGPEVWSGSASDAFHGDIEKLAPQIDKARQSYADAAHALDLYCGVLDMAQTQAAAALAEAEQAESDRETAELRRATAQQEADEAYTSYEGTTHAAWKVQRQIAVAPDPASRAALVNQLTVLESEGRQQWSAHVDAGAAAARYLANRTDAEGRLADANRKAGGIRDEVSGAAQTLSNSLKAAEREADLPNGLQRAFTESKEWWAQNEQAISEALKVIGTLCSVIAIFVPVFAVVALAIAGVVLLMDLMHDAQDGRITGSEWLGLGVDALGFVGAGGAATKFLAKGAGETSLLIRGTGAASRWAGNALDVETAGQSAEDLRERHYKDFAFDAGGVVVGRAATYGGPVLRSQIAALDKNPSIHRQLYAMSESVGHNDATFFGRSLSADRRRLVQSLIASPGEHYHGGEFLPGHSAGGTLPTDHSLRVSDLDKQLGEQLGRVADAGSDLPSELNDLGQDSSAPPTGGGW